MKKRKDWDLKNAMAQMAFAQLQLIHQKKVEENIFFIRRIGLGEGKYGCCLAGNVHNWDIVPMQKAG